MHPIVQLFTTCILDTLYPETAQSVLEVLQKAGAAVEIQPGQTCCGQPAFNAGMWSEARRVARHTISVFENTTGPVVVPSGSCAAMIRHHYAELFAEDAIWLPRATAIAERCFELTEYLVDVIGFTEFGIKFKGKITYHPSCHLTRDLGVYRQPLELLSKVMEAEIIPLPSAEDCCGFGGVFSVEHPQISNAMLERKIANIEASDAQIVIACDGGCITNINGGMHRRNKPIRVSHIADLLNGNCPQIRSK